MKIEVEAVCAEAAYDTALIHEEMGSRELAVYMPKKENADNSKTEYKREDFIYNQEAMNLFVLMERF